MQDQSAQSDLTQDSVSQDTPASYVDAYTPPAQQEPISATSAYPSVAPLTASPVSPPVSSSTAPLITTPSVAPLNVPSATSATDPAIDQDAQKALDELSKMLENNSTMVDQPEKPVDDFLSSSMNFDQKQVSQPPTSVFPTASQPDPNSSSVSVSPPLVRPAEVKSSDTLLKEIEAALEEKKSRMDSARLAMTDSNQQPVSRLSNLPPASPQVAPTSPPFLQRPATTPPVSDALPTFSDVKLPPAPVFSTPKAPAVPFAPVSTSPAPVVNARPTTESETLEDQNIFYLLGIADGSQEQKDQFLNELQQVIWEDFLDHDVELLLTEQEFKELKTKFPVDEKKPLSEQEEVIIYLERLIPDLENLMLEKAIKLKADLVKERVVSLREKFASDQAKLAEVDKADNLITQEKWLSAARVLNLLG